MTQETKHTPTPWHIRNANTDSPVIAYSDGEICSYVLHESLIAEEHGGTALDNARYIVRCVNAHAELVAALREANKALRDVVTTKDAFTEKAARALTEVRAALAKVQQ
jgi:hypothetical protein